MSRPKPNLIRLTVSPERRHLYGSVAGEHKIKLTALLENATDEWCLQSRGWYRRAGADNWVDPVFSNKNYSTEQAIEAELAYMAEKTRSK